MITLFLYAPDEDFIESLVGRAGVDNLGVKKTKMGSGHYGCVIDVPEEELDFINSLIEVRGYKKTLVDEQGPYRDANKSYTIRLD
jgi:hypothetical protein